MELSENTLTILKNYSGINANLVIEEGNVIKTVSEARNVVSKAVVSEEFPVQMGIYNLNTFLSCVGLIDSPSLVFNETEVKISDAVGRSSLTYVFSDPSILTRPLKDLNMPECEVKFTLDNDTLNKIRRASSILEHEYLKVSVVDNVLTLSVVDEGTSHVYDINVDGEFETPNFQFFFDIKNLKMLDGNYKVEISSKLISHFVNQDSEVEYWVALEKNSTYGE